MAEDEAGEKVSCYSRFTDSESIPIDFEEKEKSLHSTFDVFHPARVSENEIQPIFVDDHIEILSTDEENIKEEDHLSLLDPYFDLTTSRMRKLFGQFDSDGTIEQCETFTT